jgi:hypothetical protein
MIGSFIIVVFNKLVELKLLLILLLAMILKTVGGALEVVPTAGTGTSSPNCRVY